MEVFESITAFAAGLPTWAWVSLAVVLVVGVIWMLVDLITFLFFGSLGVIAIIFGFSYGYPYLSRALEGFTKATSRLQQAPLAMPVQAVEAEASKKPAAGN